MARAASPCKRAIIRDGQVVGWEIMKKSPKRQVIRPGQFILWDDLCQAERFRGSLVDLANFLYFDYEGIAEMCQPLYKDHSPLNRAEKAYLRRRLEK